mgnify:CR=1 FL=1
MVIEICCGHLESARAAINAGAERLELCSALPLGGLTPSPSFIRQIKAESNTPLMVLIRPREGHFYYSQQEKYQYLAEINASIAAGADGLVVGALTAEGGIDLPFLEEILAHANGLPITFHRAFDFVIEPFVALQQLIDLEIERLLTSGQQGSAWAGRALIKSLTEAASDQIIVMPGAGIHADNVRELTTFCGSKEVHLSAKKLIFQTGMSGLRPFDVDYWTADAEIIKHVTQTFLSGA